ncbi:MAG: FABP family protein [Mycobacterium sp.]|nr:FABP family protein [Mycobacterium sp.]
MNGVPALHAGVAVLHPLIGTWTGAGHGDYPTIEAFDYLEEVTFSHVGKPFLAYSQRTRSPAGTPMHAETGYLRVPAPGRIEMMLAHPTGITEIDEGTAVIHDDGTLVLDVHSTTIALTGTAKDVFAVAREVRVTGDELSYTVSMAAVGHPLQQHLTATLRRTQ